MPSDVGILRQLSRIDWNFEGALSNYGLHRLHWYPGTFIPQIPSHLIELFSRPGDSVYDPFCGIGTTLLEAVRLGRIAIGSDVNEIAVNVAKAKLHFIRPETLRSRSSRFGDDVISKCDRFGLQGGKVLFSKGSTAFLSGVADRFEILRPWYHAETWREMLVLRQAIDDETGRFSDLLKVVFSRVAKRCSSQRNHWGYVADNMRPKTLIYVDAIAAFLDALNQVIEAFERFLALPELRHFTVSQLNARSKVYKANLLNGSPLAAESVDLVVTSPPYPNVTDYTRAQRLSLWWFSKAVDDLREMEIGARFKRNRDGAIKTYLDQMNACCRNISEALLPGGYMCLVIGESEKQRKSFGVIAEIVRELERLGVRQVHEPLKRNRTRERLRRRDGESNDEFIIILRKQKRRAKSLN
ncbi:MAG: hypothetical protein JNL18_22285 [Planctomycetaceae bacterium]|nr:hypothetical protein [Planctomycetaceae bacterium]